MTIKSRVLAISWLLTAILPQAMAMSGPGDITSAQVASAIDAAGVQVLPRQVTLLTEVVVRTGVPALQVKSMEPWGVHQMRVRLGCMQPQECLPFYVTVELTRMQESEAVASLLEPVRPVPVPVVPAKTQVALRVGVPAVLLLDGSHIHIRIFVTCLESGSVGQTIRVVDKERHTYMAEICSDGILRGTL